MSTTGITPILAQNACDLEHIHDPSTAALVQQRLDTMGPMSMLFYEQPLELDHGQGAWLYDSAGKAYLDVYNNVPVLGHCHPAVIEAVTEQLSRLNTHTRYLNRDMHRYSERLLDHLRIPEGRLVFTCSGSEANDLAIRLAQRCTGKTGVIVSEAAYHGNTHLVTQVSPSSYKQGKVPDWVEVLNLDPLLTLSNTAAFSPDAVQAMVEQLEQAITRLDERGYGCAALLADSVFSSDGVITAPKGLLTTLAQRVQSQGGWWIADEVQPGFGRCGTHFWGFQHHQHTQRSTWVQPDVVTLGKPMGNGFPVAGLVASATAFAELNQEVGYFNTFGGSHAAIAAATAVLDVLERDNIPHRVQRLGESLGHGLQQLCERLPTARRVRGAGLFWGLDLHAASHPNIEDAALTRAVINHLRQAGVLIGAAGKAANTLKIRPPLCFDEHHCEHFLATLEQSLEQVSNTMT